MEKEVILYTKPDCSNCNIAKVRLYRAKVIHTITEITPEILSTLSEKYNFTGRSMPIIEVVGENAYTFDKLEEVIREL